MLPKLNYDLCKKMTNPKLWIFNNRVYKAQYPIQDCGVCYTPSSTTPVKLQSLLAHF